MSTRSSSGSWSGAGGAPADIIDLDKFMRGAVRPTRAEAHVLRDCGNKLVVDAGGVDRKPAALGPVAAAPVAAAAAPGPAPLSTPTAPSESSGSRSRPHTTLASHAPRGKHYSHDSGLSDSSYARRKHRPHRPHRRDSTGVRAPRTPAASSSHSLRAFRAVCERALLDQQAQIARVAQLCERLSERPTSTPPPPHRRSDRSVTDSSDVSSSSRSSRNPRRKDKHRRESSSSTNQPVCAQTDECKTYKIIMNKLDELNRLFAARARTPHPAPPAGPAASAARAPASTSLSDSVSVSDKLVSTESVGAERTRDLHANNVVTTRGGSNYGSCGASAGRVGGAGGASRLPQDALPHPDVAAERCPPAKNSKAMGESRAGTGTSDGDPRCGFDLEDPVHLYSQAKRLQAMSATTRRARSVNPMAKRFQHYEHDEFSQHSHRSGRSERRELSLCALCRGYWRSLTQYLASQIFCCPDAAVRDVT